MLDFNKEIKQLIENDLPQQVGQALRKKLEQADQDHKALSLAVQENEKNQEDIRILEKEIVILKEFVEIAGNLFEREQKIKEREYKQELFEAKAELHCSFELNKQINTFINSLMRNTTYRENVYKNTMGTGQWDNNGLEIKEETGHDKTTIAE